MPCISTLEAYACRNLICIHHLRTHLLEIRSRDCKLWFPIHLLIFFHRGPASFSLHTQYQCDMVWDPTKSVISLPSPETTLPLANSMPTRAPTSCLENRIRIFLSQILFQVFLSLYYWKRIHSWTFENLLPTSLRNFSSSIAAPTALHFLNRSVHSMHND